MNSFKGKINSRLAETETSIFAVMSKEAFDHKALNLSQGFPDFDVSAELIERINFYMKKGLNQYAPMTGIPEIRKSIVDKVKKFHGAEYDVDAEVNITAGATQAIFTSILSAVNRGDEVIIIEPAYDSYAPSVLMSGGTVKYTALTYPDYRVDWNHLESLITSKTRMIIINTPHNPTGSVLFKEDLEMLDKLTRNTNILVLSDEVYEHLIFDDLQHESVCRYPELVNRSFVIGSFGKTYHATGWKMGYVLAPQNLMKEFRKAHQFIVFTCNTPIQHAIADFLQDENTFLSLGKFYQRKRDYFLEQIKKSRFNVRPASGTYFQILDYSEVSDDFDYDYAIKLTREEGIASIPISPFFNNIRNDNTLRFCFAKKESTLEKAGEILCRI